MYLRSIQIENYRAIREGSVTFAQTTVLYGENDCGRSSIVEALLLILGAAGETFEARLQPFHFHRGADGRTGPLRIKLKIAEEEPGDWDLPDCMRSEFQIGAAQRRQLEFEFNASLDSSSGTIAHTWFISSPDRPGRFLEGNREALCWLRDLIPALWLRSGSLIGSTNQGSTSSGWVIGDADPALVALELHHRNLTTGNSPDLATELEEGAKAAREVLNRYKHVFGGTGSLMSAMASDILNRSQASAASPDIQSSTVAQKIGVLLLLGAILQLARRGLSADGKPILIIENPESNLHPMTLAAVSRTLERLVWQKVITTNSSTILSSAPLGSIRRLTRTQGRMTQWSVQPQLLSKDALRKVSYHLRSRRASAMFARCWLLVEGETEYWIVPELARMCGLDFAAEGIACVEFAQCGVAALAKMAGHLGIAWLVLVDGDAAGQQYAEAALRAKGSAGSTFGGVTRLRERDIEHCFWQQGFADVIRGIADPGSAVQGGAAASTIRKAIEKSSKPHLALSLIDAVAKRGPQSVPLVLRRTIESAVALARSAPGSAGPRNR